MSDDLRQQKITMWTKKLADLEKELEDTLIKKGEAAAMGDLRENAAYQSLVEAAEVLSARINNTQKILKELEDDSTRKAA